MAMSVIWAIMMAAAVVYGIVSGNIGEVGKAALNGASSAAELCISIGGIMCLWCGCLEIMKEAGLLRGLSRAMRPILRRLFPGAEKNPGALDAVSANISANILGLGNAATPMGIKAVELLSDGSGYANDSMCMLIVINTASIQLIPATICAVRSAAGAAQPFDILPAVWISSAAALTAGVTGAKMMSRFFK